MRARLMKLLQAVLWQLEKLLSGSSLGKSLSLTTPACTKPGRDRQRSGRSVHGLRQAATVSGVITELGFTQRDRGVATRARRQRQLPGVGKAI